MGKIYYLEQRYNFPVSSIFVIITTTTNNNTASYRFGMMDGAGMGLVY